MTTGSSYCPNCGKPVPQQATFCANCGTKIIPLPTPHQTTPGYLPSVQPQPSPVSTGPYKAVIGILLIIILVLLIGYASAGHLPFSLGNSRYQLANPPNLQSILPKPSPTSQLPQYPIWNACNGPPSAGCTMSSTGWREGSVPDTFDYYVSFTSTVNVTVYFFTMGQFVQFSVCNGDITCVSGSYDSILATKSLSTTVFVLGEGCADYLAVYVASGSGIMYPNVGVTPNPAHNSATGYCAQASI